jgi:hypothetical protein
MNKVQELQAELVKLCKFNRLDGEQVVADLRAHPDLWKGFVWGCFSQERATCPECGKDIPIGGGLWDLYPLQTMASGNYHADTLIVLTRKDNVPDLRDLADSWQCDWFGDITRSVIQGKRMQVADGDAVVRIWWD